MNIDFNKFTTYDPLKGVERKPLEHQKEGVYYLLDRPHSILAFDMGLGKSLTSIIASLILGEKTLVICPASLKYNWYKEFSYFFPNGLIKPEEISVINSSKDGWLDNRVTIVNYELLKNFHEIKKGKGTRNSAIWDCKYKTLIVDEAHYLKNPSSKRSKLVYDIGKAMYRKWLLTGTPIANTPIDLFQLLRITEHELSKNYIYYGKRYCDGVKNYFGWDFKGASNLTELHFKTKDVVLRKRKEDCLELKGKTRHPVHLKLDKYKDYEKAPKKYFDEVAKKIKEAIENDDYDSPFYDRDVYDSAELIEISILRRYTAEKKVPYTIEYAENMIEQGEKVVIFTNFTSVVDTLKEHFGDSAVCITGKTKNKQEVVDQFQTDPSKTVMIANLIAGGVGHNMTAASKVIKNDLHYRPDYHSQAEDRCYRIGQDKSVDVFYLLFENTIDVIIYNIVEEKQKIFNEAIEGQIELNTKGIINEIAYRLKEKQYEKPKVIKHESGEREITI